MSNDTSAHPPPNDEDLSGVSDRELVERLFREVVSLRREVKGVKRSQVRFQEKVERRLRDGDNQFGVLINSVQALCEVRGLDEHVQQLGASLERWADRRRAESGNGAAHAKDVPTNPENEIPPLPPLPNIDDDDT